MPQYKDEITKLNQEIEALKTQLLKQQLQSQNYTVSLQRAQSLNIGKPLPKDINPIIKQVRNKTLTFQEKSALILPQMFPSPPENIYYQWIAPSRISVKRDKQWYWTIALVFMFIVFFGVIARQFMLIAVALAFFFAIYVSNAVPASDTIYRLTKQGIEIGEGDSIEIYSWGQLLEYSYYFKNDTEIMYIETILASPQRIQLLFSQEDRKNINMIVEANLPYKPPPKKQSWFMKWAEGIYIPQHEFKALQEKIDKYYDVKYAEIIAALQKEGRIPNDVTIEDVRNAESIQNLKLMDEVKRQQEEEAKKILGLK